VSKPWESQCEALRAEVTALQQQVQALLTAQPVRLNAPAPRRVSRSVQWLLPICILLGGGGALYGAGAMDALFIDKDGRVGVGTVAPEGFQVALPENMKPMNPKAGITLSGGPEGNASIEVRNNGKGTPYIDFSQKVDSDYDARIRLTAPGKLAIEGAALGIGTPAPEQRVDIRSNGSRSAFTIDNALYLGNDNGTVHITNNAYPDENGAWQIKDAQKKAFTLEVRNSGMLELYGTVTNGKADWQKLATFDGANKKIEFPVALNLGSSLSVSGDIWYQGHKFVLETGIFKNSYNVEATSDRRLKKDIVPIKNAVEKVRQLSAVTYHWNDEALRHFTRDVETTVSAGPQATVEEHKKAWDAERDTRYKALASSNVGVLAQEVEAVLPEAVSTGEHGYKSVKYHYLTALLIAAFKEQEQVAQAQARVVAQHEQEIARLTAAIRTMHQAGPEQAGQLYRAARAQ